MPFGDADASRMRDIFTAETNFGRAMKSGSDLLYFHGLPEIPTSLKSADAPRQANPLADTVIGEAEYKSTDAGVWMTGQLNLGNEYEAKVWEMVKAGKLGLSTGTAAHRARRVANADGITHTIKSWPIDEVSLTPIPAHPRTSVYAIKSLLEADSGLTKYDRVVPPAVPCPECGKGSIPVKGEPGKLKCEACGHVFDEPKPATKSLTNGEEPAESVGFVESLKRAESALERAMRMPDLNGAKADAIKSLWETHKRYRDRHIDPEKVRAAIETANRLISRFKG